MAKSPGEDSIWENAFGKVPNILKELLLIKKDIFLNSKFKDSRVFSSERGSQGEVESHCERRGRTEGEEGVTREGEVMGWEGGRKWRRGECNLANKLFFF